MFYSAQEFEAQMAELIAMGYPDDLAYDIVREREQQDEAEYQEWRDAQDSRYDDQFEVDFDYN